MKLIFHAFRGASIRFGLTVLVFLSLFHALLTDKKIVSIEDQIESFSVKSSDHIHLALKQKDLTTLTETLRLILGKDAQWLIFYSPALDPIGQSSVLIGSVDFSNPFQMKRTIDVIYQGGTIAEIEYHIDAATLTWSLLKQNFILYVFVALFMISMIVYVHDGITRRLMRIENDLSRISDLAAKKNISVTDEFFKAEISKLESYSDFNSNGLIRVLKTLQSLITTEQKLKSFEATSGLARQVAHDIRSPLSALDVVLATSQGLPEDKRHLARSAITRIKDIANDLLKQNPKPIAESTEASTKSVHLISTLLEDIVSEKRLQYRSLLEAEIDFDLNEDSYGLFAEVDAVEFRRIISNLVNNAVEALPSQKGSVSLSLKSVGSRIVCEIHDTGKGIPSHLLPKLGRQGVSFGKEGTRSGSGLGLYHAIHTIEKWGGKIDIETEEARGTSVFIHLNRVEAPKWFCEKLEIKKGARVIVVDDDASIHRIWENRLQPQTFRKDIEVVHFSLPDAFATWLRDHRSDQDLYLIDYEFLGKTKTGLDLIQEMDIVRQSVLVTSRHEEPEVLARAEKMAIGLVPKAIAGIAPLHISESPSNLNLPCVLERPDAILVDDDNLVRTVWQTWAEDHGKQIRCYSDFHVLWAELKNFDKSTVIYIDSNLGVEKSGEDLAKMLFDQGFTNIYLSTGFEGSAFKNVSHLKGIVGKEPDAAFAITAR